MQLQGWYNKLQRDEVVAEWKKVRGKMSLHVHCHISGGHFLLDLCAKLRFFIFSKELPVVKLLVCNMSSLIKLQYLCALNMTATEIHVTRSGLEGLCSRRRQSVEQLPRITGSSGLGLLPFEHPSVQQSRMLGSTEGRSCAFPRGWWDPRVPSHEEGERVKRQ